MFRIGGSCCNYRSLDQSSVAIIVWVKLLADDTVPHKIFVKYCFQIYRIDLMIKTLNSFGPIIIDINNRSILINLFVCVNFGSKIMNVRTKLQTDVGR